MGLSLHYAFQATRKMEIRVSQSDDFEFPDYYELHIKTIIQDQHQKCKITFFQ